MKQREIAMMVNGEGAEVRKGRRISESESCSFAIDQTFRREIKARKLIRRHEK